MKNPHRHLLDRLFQYAAPLRFFVTEQAQEPVSVRFDKCELNFAAEIPVAYVQHCSGRKSRTYLDYSSWLDQSHQRIKANTVTVTVRIVVEVVSDAVSLLVRKWYLSVKGNKLLGE